MEFKFRRVKTDATMTYVPEEDAIVIMSDIIPDSVPVIIGHELVHRALIRLFLPRVPSPSLQDQKLYNFGEEVSDAYDYIADDNVFGYIKRNFGKKIWRECVEEHKRRKIPLCEGKFKECKECRVYKYLSKETMDEDALYCVNSEVLKRWEIMRRLRNEE